MSFNIRLKQSDAALRMLSPAGISASTKDQSEMYKVIVLDRHCKDIIAPLLRVNDLRKHGVTLHLMLENSRQPIPDVPAVYFVQPTHENIEKIVKDASDALYESMYINFVSSVPRGLLEHLASGIVKAEALQRVSKIFDQYLSFIALEPTMFSLGLPNTYIELNDPNARDTQIEASVTHVVEGLFSALVTLGVVPIIRCPKGGAAEHVASMLDSKLRDNLKSRTNLFNESAPALASSLSRPLLCLFDRNYDMAAALQHTWSYKPLVHDILGLKLNRVTLSNNGPSTSIPGSSQKKTYDVDEKDFFWETCGSHPFPKVAEEVEVQLQRYKAAVEEIGRSKDANGDVFDYEEMIRNTTQNLMSAVSSLPELQEKKKVLDKHTDIATGLLGQIKVRTLDQYYNLEEDLLTGKGDFQSVLRLIQGSTGTPADKTRLAILYLLAGETAPPDSESTELQNALRMAGGDVAASGYVRTLRRNNLVGGTAGPSAMMAGLAGSQANILEWADKTFGQGISSVTKSVKNLLSGARQMPITSAVEALTEGKQGTAEFDGFAIFDPKLPSGRAGLDRAKGPYRDAIVFVIGGGNYLERETLQAWGSRSAPPKQIIYGSTEILTGEEFVHQLGSLGVNKGGSA